MPAKQTASQIEPSPETWLRQLDTIEGADLPLVGGKAYRLAMLKQHGLNVPTGLVLTSQFFEAHLRQAKLTPLWAGSPDVAVTAEALNWLADTLKTKPLARPLAEALTTQLNALFDSSIASFAVRSSAIDEDQRNHTFAGVHLTELGVPRSAIPIAVSRCWASALSQPAIEYRQVNGMSIQAIQMAVLIQPMLSPERSGVAFTINPVTGARDELVIEVVPGLGNRLMSGQMQPHMYRLSRQSAEFPLLEHKSNAPDSTEPDPLPAAERLALAQQLEQVEALMGKPQDVEWASQAGQIYLLQTRPVSGLATVAPALSQTWIRSQSSEWLPEIPSPYWGSLLERAQPPTLEFFSATGFETGGIEAYEKIILGRPYLNLTFLKRIAAQLGLTLPANALPGSLIDLIAAGRPTVDWPTAWQARPIYRHINRYVRHADRRFKAVQTEINDAATALLAASSASAKAAAQLTQLRQQDTLFHTLNALRLELGLAIVITAAVAGQLTQISAAELAAATVQQAVTSTQKLQRAIKPLLQQAADDPALRAYLLDDSHTFEDYASQPAIPSHFRQQFDDVLTRFGNWSTYPPDPGCPRYREDQAVLLQLVRQRLAREQPDRPTDAGQRLEDDVSQIAAWRRPLAAPVVNKLRSLFKLHHELADLTAMGMAACRQWSLNLGRQWTELGWLEQPQDIFWLTLSEIERTLTAGKSTALTLSASVQTQRAKCRAYRSTPLPLTLREEQLTAIQFGEAGATADAAAVTVGLPVSPGQASGAVVVVHQPEDFSSPAGDIILVMPSTGPEWLPLLRQAAGLIVETGGLLSHGSVIAREYGIPAVANVPQATQRYHTGQRVLVDGSTGVVQLLESHTTNSPSL